MTDRQSITFTFGGLKFLLSSTEEEVPLNVIPALSTWGDFSASLVSATYSTPQIKQAVLDALSPFQVASTLWAADLLATFNSPVPETYVYFGAWFGQQVPLVKGLLSPKARVKTRHILVDKDPIACRVARQCKDETDVVLEGDAFNFDFSTFSKTALAWTGIEHFPKDKVKSYLSTLPKGTLVLLQGTDLHDVDHINRVFSEEDLLHYFHGDQVLYSGQLTAPFAKRFTVVAKT